MATKDKTVLLRLRDTGKATYGVMTPYKNGKELDTLMNIEPSALFNLKFISCIPTGTYTMVKRYSEKYKHHFHIKGVPGRELVLIHALNIFKQSEGCMGPGLRFAYVDSDNEIDVQHSRKALDYLLNVLPDESELEVVEHPKMQRMYTVK